MSLESKLREVARRKEVSQVDWARKRDEWLREVDSLYKTIEGWMGQLVSEGLIRLERQYQNVTEDYIGTYAIERMGIAFGDRVALLEPVGTNIIGAHGRIDFYPRGDKTKAFMLVLAEKADGNKEWRISDIWRRGPTTSFTQQILEGILDQWVES